jgi:hypothetical protein
MPTAREMIATILAPESLALRTPTSRVFCTDFCNKLLALGQISPGRAKLLGDLYAEALAPVLVQRAQQAPAAQIADGAEGIRALFAKAKASGLKAPKIAVVCEGLDLRIAPAPEFRRDGSRAANPGCIYIRSGEGEYLGKIDKAGGFIANGPQGEAAADAVEAFGRAPLAVGAASGHLTGRCFLCCRKLTDARSTADGYGAKCAENYGLEWGQRDKVLKAA